MKNPLYLAVFLFLFAFPCHLQAQDDLLNELKAESKPAHLEPVLATFKSNKIINIQTNETVKKQNLDFRINHLFGNMGAKSGGGIHNLYGFDQSNDIRIGFHYGITDKLMVGISRCKRHENLEGLVKYRLLEQTTDKKIPLAISLFANSTYSAVAGSLIDKQAHRMTYCTQMIIARKFSSRFSLALVPSYLHRNLVEAGDENNLFSMGGGFRLKFTRSTSLIADYFHTFRNNEPTEKHFDTIGAGVEIETGGHVFSIMFTNAAGILENDFLVNTYDDWASGGYKFSFIISRMFKMGRRHSP